MKNLIKIISAFFLMGMVSCDFLDVVPDDTATLDHAFSNRSVTDKFLRTCYSHLPDPTDPFYYPAHFTSKDEFICERDSRAKRSIAGQIADGLQNANNPLQNYWSGVNGGSNLYTAIRDCNIFLNNIHIPQDLEDWERTKWIAEVKFLKAYYHFFLMQLYGPIVIADEEVPLSTSPEDLMVYREPVDECVDYIVGLLDEAIPDLPLVLPDPATEMGRISQTIALSVKAKVLAWAASPLFNGNTDYKDWVDNRGRQLISDTYDASKWERAATAIKNAIDTCHLAGLQLYVFNKYSGGPQTYNMNDTLVQMMTIRKAITEDIERNTGVIWATQESFADGKGGAASLGFNVLGNMTRMLMPFMYTTDQPFYFNYFDASWHMAELFYTNKGVPMDEDKTFNYAGRFGVRRATPGDKHEFYIATGETTSEMHFNREPRFYADLAFDRGYVEIATCTTNGGASFSPFMQWRYGEIYTSGMYSPKKIIAFETSGSKGATGQSYSPHDYRFPLIRLADLYLLYSEALNEIKAQPDNEVYYWIDKVRENVGLNGVVSSWQNASTHPDKPNTKTGMREIIQRERLIELAFEGQRFWDIRRWKIADKYWSLPPTKWTVTSKVPEEFYIPMVYDTKRQVTFRDYLYPLREYDLRVNKNLVQTYGW
ncbi:RagB/SusD family nutrient uptake outer membrane protein [uncultured Proteiniphilum sp.]|uniref:RagB/SusD family nutrient uptake outer membrane protein n=1 Tax=uncultured Proteiniphilum sp. TaxID=497637 RepID=UPI002606CAF8|nr:RagB/SusD family nutrient uptake outer membrane protein [uncultured Proteiniphilum sp.]